jgi:hypothetical protein
MIFLVNKYTKWYFNIISNAQNRVLSADSYVEKHHIIPKSLGGTNAKENLVPLTAREHFVCHFLLIKMTTGENKKKMLHGAWSFIRASKNQERQIINSRAYSTIRSQLAKTLSTDRKGKINVVRKMSEEQKINLISKLKGQKRSDETKLKMKEAWKNRPPRSQAHKEALSASGKGRKHSEETKIKMSESKKGIIPIATLKPFICEHCGKQGVGVTNYNRWHGNNCKSLKNG